MSDGQSLSTKLTIKRPSIIWLLQCTVQSFFVRALPAKGRLSGCQAVSNIWELFQGPTGLELEAQTVADIPPVPSFWYSVSTWELQGPPAPEPCDKCRFLGHAMRILPGNLHFNINFTKDCFADSSVRTTGPRLFFRMTVLFQLLPLLLTVNIHPISHGTGPHLQVSTGPNIYKRLK